MIHEWVHCCDEAANHQLSIAVAFWIIWIVFLEKCLSLTQNLLQICCPTYSVILNGTVTQYTCSLNSVYRPHWLVQWCHHCSYMCIPVHSPWLTGYIDVAQTILVTLTMAGCFLDRQTSYLRFCSWLNFKIQCGFWWLSFPYIKNHAFQFL